MNSWKRICVTLNAHINSLIDQVENHEAVAEAAMNDVREALANTVFHLKRLQAEKNQMETKLTGLSEKQTKLKERALAIKDSDRDQALECMRRVVAAQNEVNVLTSQIKEHAELAESLTSDVAKIQAKFSELKYRRAQLAARSSRAEALGSVSRQDVSSNLAGTFERWERSVLRSEVDVDLSSGSEGLPDPLMMKIEKENEKAELESMLNALVDPGQS